MRLRSGTSFPEPAPPLLQLPGPLLTAILQQLDRTSLLRAARACNQLHAAAIPLLTSIKANPHTRPRQTSLMRYLQRYGQHVSSPGIERWKAARLPDSCSGLQALTLRFVEGTLGAAGSQPGVLQAVEGSLTSLCIHCSHQLTDSPPSIAGIIARLTNLQRLDLCRANVSAHAWAAWNSTPRSTEGIMPGSMLTPLRALTALALADDTTVSSWVGSASPWLRAATLEHLSSLDRLRELKLRGSNGHTKFPIGVALTTLQHLSLLTALDLAQLECAHLSLPDPNNSLQRLKMASCDGFSPQALAGCSQLRHLELEHCYHGPGAQLELEPLEHCCKQLTLLRLDSAYLLQPPATTLAALTASSCLQVLYLRGIRVSPAAWQAMFGEAADADAPRMPRLRELRVEVSGGAAIGETHMKALAQCCPGLLTLEIAGLDCLSAPANLLPLTALTNLASLRFEKSGASSRSPTSWQIRGRPPTDVAGQLREWVEMEIAWPTVRRPNYYY